jgi:hypothetical protein
VRLSIVWERVGPSLLANVMFSAFGATLSMMPACLLLAPTRFTLRPRLKNYKLYAMAPSRFQRTH